jgi:hypothetical protein
VGGRGKGGKRRMRGRWRKWRSREGTRRMNNAEEEEEEEEKRTLGVTILAWRFC